MLDSLVDDAFAADVWCEGASNELILRPRDSPNLYLLDFSLFADQAIDIQGFEETLTVVAIKTAST